MNKRKDKQKLLERFRYPLLMLIVGVFLMLLPTGRSVNPAAEGDSSLKEILSSASGVGRTEVLVSDSGVVVVCQGADAAHVRLDIIRAVHSYTGFGSDKITILKMAD